MGRTEVAVAGLVRRGVKRLRELLSADQDPRDAEPRPPTTRPSYISAKISSERRAFPRS